MTLSLAPVIALIIALVIVAVIYFVLKWIIGETMVASTPVLKILNLVFGAVGLILVLRYLWVLIG